MTTAIPADARRFRIKIVPPTIFICVGGLLLGIVGFFGLLLIKHGLHINWAAVVKSISLTLPLLAGFALLSAIALSWLLPSYISSGGIHGHSFWGVRCFLSWADIGIARRFKMGNLTYVRLYSGGKGPVMWLPLFQKPSGEFGNQIRKFAPAGNSILAHLN